MEVLPSKKALLFNNEKLVRILLVISLVILISLIGSYTFFLKNNVIPELTQNKLVQSQSQQPRRSGEIIVKATGSKYKTASQKPTSGWFTTGQDADIMLSGVDFNNTGGALSFHHPGGIATDGKRLLLADTWNNRVLIWNKLSTNGKTPPDLVLGQKDFTSNNPGTGLDQLNWPISVSTAKDKVVITDTNNGRILVWNSFPTSNAKAADFVIETKKIPGTISLIWPWGAWTNGEKLAITSTHGAGTVYLWHNFPANGDQKPDVILRDKDFGTPRTITSNGEYLLVSDHNANIPPPEDRPRQGGQPNGPATFVWKSWPTKPVPYDFVMDGWESGVFLPDGGLALVGPLSPLKIWKELPESTEDKADLTVGIANMGPFTKGLGYQFVTGDSSGLAYADGRIYIGMGNGNKVIVYNKIPQSQTDFPDFAIGSPDINTNTLETNYIIANPILSTDGKSLVATSDFDRKMYVWKSLPAESGAYPDFVYTFNEVCGADSAIWGSTLIVGSKRSLCLWKKIPLSGEQPDVIFSGKVGNVEFDGFSGIALDDKYFYLVAVKEGIKASLLYVWEGIPDENSEPKYTIPVEDFGRLSSDGKYLVGIVTRTDTIGVFEVDKLSNSSKPALLPANKLNPSAPISFNGPGRAIVKDNHLFVSDVGYGRVLGWTNIKDALAGKSADIILGEDNLQDIKQEIGKNKVFWPSSLTFDGSFLWVGETKFSNRILRFSVH